ncbi:efflux RND transporter periplasmic adaptor subunit [Geomicrobium sp. JCM 19038]|uniref:efflux RND transporter periplasmic adaptor subunit n=1 Tax=Geomicrobium sp. JCM 19038 TaxID=1460635 RepID=UPI00045F3A7D|nr:efflux RND transporter periplasmic adaptor subunit [Geomicrobium sp. JCM 19038]GAK10073.1 periplasmic component of efflux system [Geomicrobium sp. JCM 19038]
MKKRIGILIGLLMLGGLMVGNSYILSEGMTTDDPVVVTNVLTSEETLYDTIIANGRVEPGESQAIFEEPQHGTVYDIHVNEGEEVFEGDVLITYENQEITRQLVSLRNNLDRLMVEMEQQNDQISTIESQISTERSNRDDDDPFDQTDQVIRQLENERDAMEYQRRLTNLQYSEQEEEIAYLEDQELHEIYSDVNGIVEHANYPNEVEEGQPLIRIQSDEFWNVNGTVTEYDLIQLHEEMEVEVEANVLPDQTFEGFLARLGSTPADEEQSIQAEGSNVTSYPFEVQLHDQSEDLLHGFHVNVYFEVEAEADAVVVQASAIETVYNEFTGDEENYVYQVEEGIARMQAVETGITNEQGVQILSGLEAGESVIDLEPLETIYEGMEVVVNDPPEES